MDYVFDLVINVAAHGIGIRLLRFLTGGRFEGESGYTWGCAF